MNRPVGRFQVGMRELGVFFYLHQKRSLLWVKLHAQAWAWVEVQFAVFEIDKILVEIRRTLRLTTTQLHHGARRAARPQHVYQRGGRERAR